MVASIVAIIASVAPHVTVMWRSGSTSSPLNHRTFSAIACRRRGAPQVTAYWLCPSASACAPAASRSAGAGKSGKPWARLIAPCSIASRVISRITDSVKTPTRAAVKIISSPSRIPVERFNFMVAGVPLSRMPRFHAVRTPPARPRRGCLVRHHALDAQHVLDLADPLHHRGQLADVADVHYDAGDGHLVLAHA